MDIEKLQALCKSLPQVTEDIKWGNDLCFCVGGKMFCVAGIGEQPVSASFKVTDDQFEEMSRRSGFRPAPYVARYKWVLADDLNAMGIKEWEMYVKQSYSLVRDKLPPKIKKELGLI
jgi:predicted DNA-binding protein (MmcQ/YjbR family)